jgi:hypothetical protein
MFDEKMNAIAFRAWSFFGNSSSGFGHSKIPAAGNAAEPGAAGHPSIKLRPADCEIALCFSRAALV